MIHKNAHKSHLHDKATMPLRTTKCSRQLPYNFVASQWSKIECEECFTEGFKNASNTDLRRRIYKHAINKFGPGFDSDEPQKNA